MNKMSAVLFLSLFFLSLAASALAVPPPPQILSTISGVTVSVAWTPVSDAVGYTLFYAPAPYTGPESIGVIELGEESSYSQELWEGAAYFVAVKSYDQQGYSDYSNIESFAITSGDSPAGLKIASSAAELEDYLKRGLQQQSSPTGVYRYPLLEFAVNDVAGLPPGQAVNNPAYSTTNLQVSGVDEADQVKSDGNLLFVVEQDSNYSFAERQSRNIRVLALNDAQATETGRIPLANALPLQGLYLLEDRGANNEDYLVSLGTSEDYYYPCALDWFAPWSWQKRQTDVHLIDVSTPESAQVIHNYLFDGQLVGSRRIGDKLYIVLRYNPSLEGFLPYPQTEEDLRNNEELIENASLTQLLPHYQFDGAERGTIASYDRYYLPEIATESVTADVLTVVSIDLLNPELPPYVVTLAGPVETLYMSTQSLYLATTSYRYEHFSEDGAVSYDSSMTTDLHKLSLTEAGAEYRGSGSVDGHLGWDQDKKSFRLGEVGDALGVATSIGESWDGGETTKLTFLAESPESPGLLDEIGHLPNSARPEPLGKRGERLYAARFIGERLFLVTFRVTDPLYVLNVANPRDPFIAGSLEIDGYSDYLQPLGENLLLGVGKDAVADLSAPEEERGAWYQGLKLSLFDITDVSRPQEVESVVIGKRGTDSELLSDHHAIAFLDTSYLRPGSAKLAIPVEMHDRPNGYDDPAQPWSHYDWTHTGLYLFELSGINGSGNAGLRLAGNMIVETAAEEDYNWSAGVDRALIVGDNVHFIHDNDVWSSSWQNPDQLSGPQ